MNMWIKRRKINQDDSCKYVLSVGSLLQMFPPYYPPHIYRAIIQYENKIQLELRFPDDHDGMLMLP